MASKQTNKINLVLKKSRTTTETNNKNKQQYRNEIAVNRFGSVILTRYTEENKNRFNKRQQLEIKIYSV